ncbi:hypothetical protein [Streptomyces sp. NPDC088847]|uniref:hypothetical protein n=1 Tax=Streptomyces sp. NPDC088847 TaxID=3365909 RepID=UPI00382D4A31
MTMSSAFVRDGRQDVIAYNTLGRALHTAEPGSTSEERLELLASLAATPSALRRPSRTITGADRPVRTSPWAAGYCPPPTADRTAVLVAAGRQSAWAEAGRPLRLPAGARQLQPYVTERT